MEEVDYLMNEYVPYIEKLYNTLDTSYKKLQNDYNDIVKKTDDLSSSKSSYTAVAIIFIILFIICLVVILFLYLKLKNASSSGDTSTGLMRS